MKNSNRKKGTLKYLIGREFQASETSWHPLMSSTTLFQDRLNSASNLYRRDLFAHFGCVNAIEFSQEGLHLISGGDDRRVLLWNLETSNSTPFRPIQMKGDHNSNIFCLGFNSSNSKIFSAGNDEQVIIHDVETREPINSFLHEEAIYGISVNPYLDSVFASAGEDGQVLLFDTRSPKTEEPLLLARSYDPFHSVQFHPVEPRFIVTANPKEGIVLWDVRKPRIHFMRYGDKKSPESSMSARFNTNGTQIIALRRRLPPILFNTHSSSPVCQFDADHYYNSCTMKSCCFAGSCDQFVLSGSDDFNLYMWNIPSQDSGIRFVPEAHLVLKGHRSIVNQVRFNGNSFAIASSGVEKIIKLWSPVLIPGSHGDLDFETDAPSMTRKVYTHEEYIGLVLESGVNMSHNYNQGNTTEDPRMMAFFDSLVQRELEGCTTNTDLSDDATTSTSSGSSSEDQSANSDSGWSSQPHLSSTTSDSAGTRQSHCSPVHHLDTHGREWILRLIAKKRAQIRASKKKRKLRKVNQKFKSQKFVRCLTKSRSRRYLYSHENCRSHPSSTSTSELIRRRHVVAPYTVMSLGSYMGSDEEEDEDDDDDDDKTRTSERGSRHRRRGRGRLSSSDESLSGQDGKRGESGSTSKDKTLINDLLSEIIDSDQSDGEINNGANRLRNSDDQKDGVDNASDISEGDDEETIPLSSISVGSSGSILFNDRKEKKKRRKQDMGSKCKKNSKVLFSEQTHRPSGTSSSDLVLNFYTEIVNDDERCGNSKNLVKNSDCSKNGGSDIPVESPIAAFGDNTLALHRQCETGCSLKSSINLLSPEGTSSSLNHDMLDNGSGLSHSSAIDSHHNERKVDSSAGVSFKKKTTSRNRHYRSKDDDS